MYRKGKYSRLSEIVLAFRRSKLRSYEGTAAEIVDIGFAVLDPDKE